MAANKPPAARPIVLVPCLPVPACAMPEVSVLPFPPPPHRPSDRLHLRVCIHTPTKLPHAGAAGRRPSTSGGGWPTSPSAGSPTGSGGKVPVTQRLAQMKAVYSAHKFSRSLESILQSGAARGVQPGGAGSYGSPTAYGGNGGYGGSGYGTQRPSTPPRREGQRPIAFTCYLCGQPYGSQSLLKHIPQCQKKWLMVEGAKPRREQRPLPPMPPELEAGELPSRSEDIEEFNQRMYQYWDKVSLVACPICARTFR